MAQRRRTLARRHKPPPHFPPDEFFNKPPPHFTYNNSIHNYIFPPPARTTLRSPATLAPGQHTVSRPPTPHLLLRRAQHRSEEREKQLKIAARWASSMRSHRPTPLPRLARCGIRPPRQRHALRQRANAYDILLTFSLSSGRLTRSPEGFRVTRVSSVPVFDGHSEVSTVEFFGLRDK